MNEPIKIKFAQSFFEEFEGDQAELDSVMAEIQRLADTGELFDKAIIVDLDELADFDDTQLAINVSTKTVH